MIRAWRIDWAQLPQRKAFSGEGARRIPGRWNSRGRPIVYAASSLSLATLERFVHMEHDADDMEFVSCEIQIPTAVRSVQWGPSEMPKDWRGSPPPASTQALGDAWLAARKSAVLLVPSVITPAEFNVLMNPGHPDFGKIKILPPQPFSFDLRLWKS